MADKPPETNIMNQSKTHSVHTSKDTGISNQEKHPTSFERFKVRRIPVQNIVLKLQRRETYGTEKATSFILTRKFYRSFFPNFSVLNVDKPPCYLRKFSPDGRFFIGFSLDQTCLQIYRFQGSGAAGDLLKNCTGEQTVGEAGENSDIKSKIFETFFKLHSAIHVIQRGHQLNRECSLFTECGRYIIVASASDVPEDRPSFFEVYTNNESVIPNRKRPLGDFILYLIHLESGTLRDTRLFKTDKIFMSHNQGLYLYRDVLAVLSVQHQTIHMFKITDRFLNIRTIGRNCFEDDDFLLSAGLPPTVRQRPFREVTINSLKHRILVSLFLRAKAISQVEGNLYELMTFFRHFDLILNLRMYRMQLLDDEHLLIKYAPEDVVTQRNKEPAHLLLALFVVYNISAGTVLFVSENNSPSLAQIFADYCDNFRNTAWSSSNHCVCSPSNNIYARTIQQRCKPLILCTRNSGHMESAKRILAYMPITAQVYSSSPYLDLGLFAYDETWIGIMEHPRYTCEHPIRFYERESGLQKFSLFVGFIDKTVRFIKRRPLVDFTFHPHEPFAISVQRTESNYVFNFHVRHVNTWHSSEKDDQFLN